MTCRSSSQLPRRQFTPLFYAVAVVSIYIYGFVAALRVAGFLLPQFRCDLVQKRVGKMAMEQQQ